MGYVRVLGSQKSSFGEEAVPEEGEREGHEVRTIESNWAEGDKLSFDQYSSIERLGIRLGECCRLSNRVRTGTTVVKENFPHSMYTSETIF